MENFCVWRVENPRIVELSLNMALKTMNLGNTIKIWYNIGWSFLYLLCLGQDQERLQ